ncbi:MAG: hypothetical protein FWB78_09695 [Treponema sp.]|nr:hypothetical protein [Treponema sp.]
MDDAPRASRIPVAIGIALSLSNDNYSGNGAGLSSSVPVDSLSVPEIQYLRPFSPMHLHGAWKSIFD